MADWRPTADWPMLERRAALLRRLRAFFDERGFLEVETPLLSADAVVDRHLDPIEAVCDGTVVEGGREPGQGGTRRFLQTSPEFALKRLMAAGGKAIYQVAHAFRRGEFGRLHNPEFTLVEWYRRGDDLAAGMRLLSDLAEALLARGPAERLTYADAFSRWAGIDPLVPDIPAWAELLRRAGVEPPASFAADDPDAWLDLILLELVEPQLGRDRPIIIYDYPVSQAALARVRPDDPRVAERFELYDRGIELANGYHELLDPAVLRERNRANNAWRVRDGKQALPEESRLLAAMEAGLPASTGVALGFDRIVMLALGAASLAEVIPFPFDRA